MLRCTYADVAELVDALASGASVLRDVEVQVLSSVPNKEDLFGLFCLAVYRMKRKVKSLESAVAVFESDGSVRDRGYRP